MILIADSGSTKTEWCLINESGKPDYCSTKGINPFYQSSQEISTSLKNDFKIDISSTTEIFFYGAGCINEEMKGVVKTALINYFNTEKINIESDLLGAARSLCQHSEGIVCILGTGSNSCYYDGNLIIENVSPLGYILGDEGSGAIIGKKLLSDILKKQMSKSTIKLFYNTYNTEPNDILENAYKKSFPNKYLATYTKFISENIHIEELEDIVISSFNEFIERNILQYSNIKRLPIHFTGSIAFHFRDQLTKAMNQAKLTLGYTTKTPMQGLLKYHQKDVI